MITVNDNGMPLIDPRHDAGDSIVLRYRHALTFEPCREQNEAFKEILCQTSIREGLRILPLVTYRGVEMHLLDESSRMHTTTMRSIDGCVTAARARFHGHQSLVCVSGGNSGTALTEYSQKAGLETFLFVPLENLGVLNSRVFAPKRAHLIAVEEPGLVKPAATLFETLTRFKRIPELTWRYEAARLRGLFILENLLQGPRMDWISQTISAAFGPIGVYSVLERFEDRLGYLPRFLGLQQEANCPMYRAWVSRSTQAASVPFHSTAHLLSRILYDAEPFTYGTYEALQALLDHCGGALTTMNHLEFEDFNARSLDGRRMVELLADHEIHITTLNGDVVDKTGLMALLGTLKAIDQGTIPRGARVLCSLTSGMSDADQLAKPEYIVTRHGFEESVKALHQRVTQNQKN